jgi:precorrin-6x reductase
MYDVIVFGGTTEGRELAEFLAAGKVPALVCVATEYGGKLLSCRAPVRVRSGRLDRAEIAELLAAGRPKLVVDATHPYAALISENLRCACASKGLRYVRVLRERAACGGENRFADMDELVAWLNGTEGIVFAATGAKEARALTGVRDYAARVYLRILPSPEGIAACAQMGYPMSHLICMQGPFSEEMNIAMFREVSAAVLVTKESGKNGGFPEKLSAANKCGMKTAVLTRPAETSGLTPDEAKAVIAKVCG